MEEERLGLKEGETLEHLSPYLWLSVSPHHNACLFILQSPLPLCSELISEWISLLT